MSSKLTETEIIGKLGKQKNFLNDSQTEVTKLFEYKRNCDTIYNVALKLYSDSYMKVMSQYCLEEMEDFYGILIIQCFKYKSSECKY